MYSLGQFTSLFQRIRHRSKLANGTKEVPENQSLWTTYIVCRPKVHGKSDSRPKSNRRLLPGISTWFNLTGSSGENTVRHQDPVAVLMNPSSALATLSVGRHLSLDLMTRIFHPFQSARGTLCIFTFCAMSAIGGPRHLSVVKIYPKENGVSQFNVEIKIE